MVKTRTLSVRLPPAERVANCTLSEVEGTAEFLVKFASLVMAEVGT